MSKEKPRYVFTACRIVEEAVLMVTPTHHTVSRLKDRDGRHVGLVSMVRDTSERKKH